MSFIEESLFPYFLKSPPFGLDISIVVCYIGVVHVCPESDTVAHLFPFVAVLPYAFLTFFNERLYTVVFNLRLSAYAKLFFNLKLYGKTVSIPTAFSENVIAFHNSVTEYKVFYRSCLNMSDMRLSVSCGRAFYPCKSGISLS